MHATTIVGYAYEAALHCVDCAAKRFADYSKDFKDMDGSLDEYRIPFAAVDREGNTVTPVFADQAEEGECCDDCFDELL